MPALDPEEPLVPPRPGSLCANHPTRTAVVQCALCGKDQCFSCFFPELGRCQRCVEEHPEELSEPVPFEAKGVIAGFFGTFTSALSPRTSAPSFAIGSSLSRPALFFALSFVPLAALRGIIPFAHRIHFGPLGSMVIAEGSTTNYLVRDLLRASGVSLLECTASLLAFAISHTSLVKAFGRPEAATIAARAIAYRAFLLPLGGVFGLLASLFAWLGPSAFGGLDALAAIGWLPLLPFYFAVHRSSRTVGRVELFPGLLAIAVPWVIAFLVDGFVLRGLSSFLPPELRG